MLGLRRRRRPFLLAAISFRGLFGLRRRFPLCGGDDRDRGKGEEGNRARLAKESERERRRRPSTLTRTDIQASTAPLKYPNDLLRVRPTFA